MRDVIGLDKLESALEFLANSDHDYAIEKAELERSEILRKRTRARVFQLSDGTVAERQALAETHPDVQDADDKYCNNIERFETLKARRQRAEIVVDVWRSLEASRRKA